MCIDTCIYVYMCICICVCVYVYVRCVYSYVCMCIRCVCVCVCVYIYIKHFFIHLSIIEHLSFYHISAIVSYVAVNTGVHVSL